PFSGAGNPEYSSHRCGVGVGLMGLLSSIAFFAKCPQIVIVSRTAPFHWDDVIHDQFYSVVNRSATPPATPMIPVKHAIALVLAHVRSFDGCRVAYQAAKHVTVCNGFDVPPFLRQFANTARPFRYLGHLDNVLPRNRCPDALLQ